MSNYQLIIAYDGKRYKGWRKTKADDDQTIQGKLEILLKKLYQTDVEVIGAINTDAGVHAQQQIANFISPDESLNAKKIQEAFDEYLPEDIVVRKVIKADDRFHSKYKCKSITFTYRLWKKNSAERPLFQRHLVYPMQEILDVERMKEAAEVLEGEHDFTAFSTKSKTNSNLKTMYSVEIKETDSEIMIVMKASGYLLNMERIIVGTLIQIGLKERPVISIQKAFKSLDRKDAGHKSMAHSLCLTEIELL